MNSSLFIQNLLSNSIFLLKPNEIENIFLKRTSLRDGSLSVLYDFFTFEPSRFESNRFFLSESLLSVVSGIVLWRLKWQGLSPDGLYEKFFSKIHITDRTPNIINVARLAPVAGRELPISQSFKADWEQFEFLYQKDSLESDLNDVLDFLNVYGTYLCSSSAFKQIESDLNHTFRWKSNVLRENDVSIGSLLLLLYDLQWCTCEDWEWVEDYAASYNLKLVGIDFSGIVAGKRIFGRKISKVIHRLGLSQFEEIWNEIDEHPCPNRDDK